MKENRKNQKKHIPVIGIAGWSGSGKTTLLVNLIPAIREIAWENGNTTEESRESMNDITLAYSISIHKSQGSEYDCCIIPLLSDQICRLFQSNLLYTGITRSKKKTILVCDEGHKALDYCVSADHKQKLQRNTLLMQRIKSVVKATA